MKRIVFLILLVLITLSACGRKPAVLGADAPVDNVPSIIGEYALNGFDPSGEEYGGRLSITAAENLNEYKLNWLVTGGVHEGIGMLEGNQLNVIWHSVSGAVENISGVANYTVTVNGELYGTRSINGVENEGVETAYPNKK